MQDKLISTFYKEDVPAFASGDNIRKISSYIDGLKLSARKLVYTMLEKYPNSSIKTKTAQFANVAAAFTNYNQGENNLGGVSNTLAQDFCGTNNYPLFIGRGNFGNRLDDLCAATRYTFLSASKILKTLFKPYDNIIVGNQIYEGDKIEPLYYVPVISTLFLNGSNGISTGFRQVILPRNINDVIEYITKRLNGIEKPRTKLIPWWKDFKGSCRYNLDGNLEILGCIERINTTTYRITELPISVQYTKYCDFLDKLEENGTIQDWKDLCDPKTNSLLFEIKTTRDFSKKYQDIENLLKIFHLIKPFTEHYNCIDENNRVREFSSIQEILDAFITLRLEYYNKRKQYILDTLRNNLEKTNSKYLFVKAIVDKKIIVANRKKADIIEQIKTVKGIVEIDGSHEYLLRMQIYNLSTEMLEALKKEIDDTQIEYKNIEQTSIQDMWLDDLKELKKTLS